MRHHEHLEHLEEELFKGKAAKARHRLERPTIISIFAITFTAIGLIMNGTGHYHDTAQTRITMWNTMRKEFNHEMKKDRRACGNTFGTKEFDSQYSNVMDYFDTVGYMVLTDRIDADLFINTWGYYFSGYVRGAREYLEKERRQDPNSYASIFTIEEKFHDQLLHVGPKDLNEFFKDESRLPV